MTVPLFLRTCPCLDSQKVEQCGELLKKNVLCPQLGTYDVETDLASVNDMKSVANSTFKKLEDLLDTALEDARQLHAAETKARGSSSSLKRFLGRR